MKRIAVLTSGGDAPGMNAATRAVVRSGVSCGFEMFGARRGYAGLIAGDFIALGARDVGGIIHRGGTVLGTSRCDELRSEAGQRQARAQLQRHGIDAIVVIGGNGSQSGAYALAQRGVCVVGVASTIDNDLSGTDISIGVTTALDIALEAIDRLRVTAASHERAFLVEVMGRSCGYLAAVAAIAGGAEAVAIPEIQTDPEAIARQLHASRERGKSHAIVVVAEGASCDADDLCRYFREHGARIGFELRVSRLGHVQRGGAPGVFDRMLATRLGAAAIARLAAGERDILVGLRGADVASTPLAEVVGRARPLDLGLIGLANTLAA